jgi:hypothetical protein
LIVVQFGFSREISRIGEVGGFACPNRGRNAGGVCAARQGSLRAVQKLENTLTSKFGASGTGCCNVRASNFRPAKIHPATGNLNVDSFRIAELFIRPTARRIPTHLDSSFLPVSPDIGRCTECTDGPEVKLGERVCSASESELKNLNCQPNLRRR